MGRLSAMTSADAADTLRSLAYLGIPKGLSNTVAQSVKAHPLRIMIVDNSGSMNTCDGNKMLNNNGSVKMVKCSLAYLGIPKGLSNAVAQSVKAHPLRIMIVDNSGSMNTRDRVRS